MSDPRLSSILSRYNLTLSQRMGLERDIGELMKPGASVVALVEAYGVAYYDKGRGDGRRGDMQDLAAWEADNARVTTAKSALLAAIAAPAIDSARPTWESMPNGLHEMWWTLDVYRNGDCELYAIVKERDDRSTATWAVSAQGDGDDHAAIAEGVADSVDAAQLAAESALRTIARGIATAIAAVPSEVVAAAREVMRLDTPRKVPPAPWVVNKFDNDEGGIDYQIQSEGIEPDGGTSGSIIGSCDGHELKGRARHTAAFVVHARTAAPLLAAWVIAQAEGRGES